jgi:hypothetical protein
MAGENYGWFEWNRAYSGEILRLSTSERKIYTLPSGVWLETPRIRLVASKINDTEIF